jgi:DNA (cytosine-5)-methyltransferase 1
MSQRKKKLSIVAVDLFCGIGGLTYGLNKSGIKVVAGVDLDEKCKFAFETNNNASFINQSVKELASKNILGLYPKGSIKALVGCAPCQPFSKHTQKAKGREEKEDWGLLYHFLELIKKVKPVVVSMENVPQIVKHKVFSDFVEGLKEKKYYANWQNVYCPDYGVPQSRRRLVLLASKLGEMKLISPTHRPKNYKTVKMAIGNLEPLKAGSYSIKRLLYRRLILGELRNRCKVGHGEIGTKVYEHLVIKKNLVILIVLFTLG